MPRVPTTSPVTGNPVHPSYIHTTALNFVDNAGRTLLLRGVNLSGASKAPVGHPSYILEDFWDSAEKGGESFIGRPLNVDDGSADVHLARLRGWGFNFLRFPFTWEALEHEGPGKYDYEYMDYTIRVLCKCREYGFRVYMDPHQDTWSRFSGGSGAPFWTLAACGINPRNITATQAAILHCEYPLAHEPDPASLPAMVWSTNYGRMLSQSVFTLFFAGRDFAPNCIIDGVNIQDYLQSHFIEACGQFVDRIRVFDDGSLFEECIIGWDSINEPFEGFCGWEDLNANPTKQGSTLKKGTYPTPAQSLRLGMGQAQTVDNWTFGTMGPSRNGSVTIDPKGRKLWADPVSPTSQGQEDPRKPSGDDDEAFVGELPDGTHPRWGWKRDVSKWPLGTCIWAQNGVWDIETGFILRPDYFRFRPAPTGEDLEVEFLSDYWKPHWLVFAERVRRSHPEAIVFVQPPVFAPPPQMDEEEVKGRCAYSPHYYDGLTLITRHWNWFNADALGLLRGKYSSTLQAVKIGEGAIRKSLHEQLGYLQDDVSAIGGSGGADDPSLSSSSTTSGRGCYPTVIGEIGTPFDMDGKRSYGWTDGGKHKGDFGNQEKALDASLNACDGDRALNWTVWTYVPDDHTHEWGDAWNMEDLSLWSPDDLVGSGDDYTDGGEEMYKEMRQMDGSGYVEEDALDSRVVLMDRERDDNRRRRVQPTKSLPMTTAPASSLSVATLGAASTTSLGTSNMKMGAVTSTSNTGSAMRKRTVSTASRSTTSSSVSRSGRPHSPYEGIAGYTTNPYTFLTDGARAVRAFARPWPAKVVGRPLDVKFDIGKGVFRLVVVVGSEDRVGKRMNKERSNVKGGVDVDGEDVNADGHEDENTATEVYIPLVHYAHPRLLEDAAAAAGDSGSRKRRSGRRRTQQEDEDARSIASVTTAVPTPQIPPQVFSFVVDDDVDEGRNEGRDVLGATTMTATPAMVVPMAETETDAHTIVETDAHSGSTAVGSEMHPSAIENEDEHEHDSDLVASSKTPFISGKHNASSRIPAAVRAPLLISDNFYPASYPASYSDSDPDSSHLLPIPLIDVQVKVSVGHVKVSGQRVLWWYDVPEEGEPAREYVMEVRRRGGVLKAPSNANERGVVRKDEEEGGVFGWCEQLCPESGPCVVM